MITFFARGNPFNMGYGVFRCANDTLQMRRSFSEMLASDRPALVGASPPKWSKMVCDAFSHG